PEGALLAAYARNRLSGAVWGLLAIGLIASLVLFWLPPGTAAGWAAAALAGHGASLMLCRWFLSYPPALNEQAMWRRHLLFAEGISGTAWGALLLAVSTSASGDPVAALF